MKISQLQRHLLLAALLFAPAFAQTNWTAATSGTTQNLWGVVFGNNQFVAVGEAGTILTSVDGVSWITRSSGTTRWLLAVTWSPELGRFAAVGDAGTVLTSNDGVAWTLRTSNISQRLNGIAWGDGVFLAAGENGVACTSPDGSTWTPSTTGVSGWLRGVAFGAGTFVAVGQSGTVLTSLDQGITFHRRGIATSAGLEGAVFFDGKYYVAGERFTVGESSDLAYWTVSSTQGGATLRSLTKLDFGTLAVGDADSIRDAQPTKLATPLIDWRGVAANGARIVLVGTGGRIATTALSRSGTRSITLTPTADSRPFPGSRYTIEAGQYRSLATNWQWNHDGKIISGATAPSLVIPSLVLADAGNYTVTATLGSDTIRGEYPLTLKPGQPTLDLVDANFQPALPGPPGLVVPLADGRLYVTSSLAFFEFGGRLQHGIARLKTDGSLDPTFNVGSGTDPEATIESVDVLPDGRVVVSGSFTTISGISRPTLARLLEDGTVDTTFQPDVRITNPSSGLRFLLPDGRWVVGSTANQRLTFSRFTASGAFDATYQSASIDLSERPQAIGGSYVFAGAAPSLHDPIGRHYFTVAFNYHIFGTTMNETTNYFRLTAEGVLDGNDPVLTSSQSHQTPLVGSSSQILEFSDQRYLSQGSSFSNSKFGGGEDYHGIAVGRLDGSSGLSPASYFWSYFASLPSYGYGMFATMAADGLYANAAGTRGRTGIVRIDWQGKFDPDFACEIADPDFTFGWPVPLTPSGYKMLPSGQILMRATSINYQPVRYLARLTPNRTAGSTRLSNISVRARAGTEGQTLIVGFVVANGSKKVLVRGGGPALAQFGVTNSLADPQIALFQGGTGIASNDDWNVTASAAANSVGAFAFDPGSRDAALVADNPTGAYTVQVSGKDDSNGIALAELYDLDTRPAHAAGPRLANFSVRTVAGANSDTLIAGFTIDGNNTRTVLIRAIGPGLRQFGVTGEMSDPMLTLFRGSTAIATNDNWSDGTTPNPYWNDPAARLAEVFQTVGAFGLDMKGKDAALAVTLTPGAYTAQVTSANGTSGVVLLEVYEVP